MKTEDEANKRACELLKKHFISENYPDYAVYDDDYIIRNYPDEWSWFMQGWKETVEFNKNNEGLQ